MAERTGLLVKDVVEGGSASNGDQVFFTLRLDNGESERDLMFICPHGAFPNLVQALLAYGGAADADRVEKGETENGDGHSVSRMPTASGVKAGKLVGEGESKVALRFTLPTGMNFDIAIDDVQARELMNQIGEQLGA